MMMMMMIIIIIIIIIAHQVYAQITEVNVSVLLQNANI
jgi:hypothetical protein